jgi:hypothetical protein
MGTGSSGRWGMVRCVRWAILAIPLALAAVVGCTGHKGGHAPEYLTSKQWANSTATDDYQHADTIAASGLALAMQGAAPAQPAGKPLNVLCVSGGGKYAAFTAGALCGWTASGTRPTFDVATGVSSGAPTAFLAFLGPKYDDVLADIFLKLHRSDMYVWRPVRGIIKGTGLMSSRPLAQMLDERINEQVMNDLRAAHAEGRRLFIATSNALTHRLVVWDMGAIASSGRPDATIIVRKVVLAACSIPGIVPPVAFDVTVNGMHYTELHADAGNLAQVFVTTPGPLPPGSAVWVLSAGKTHPNSAKGTPRVLESMSMAVSTTLYALFRADAMKLYALCGVTRSQFRMIALPNDFNGHTSSMVFDPVESHRMYWIGYQMATGGNWQTQPPDSAPGELSPPRTGVEFVTRE